MILFSKMNVPVRLGYQPCILISSLSIIQYFYLCFSKFIAMYFKVNFCAFIIIVIYQNNSMSVIQNEFILTE